MKTVHFLPGKIVVSIPAVLLISIIIGAILKNYKRLLRFARNGRGLAVDLVVIARDRVPK